MRIISAKTPIAAKIAPMMIFVGFVSLVVDVGGVDGADGVCDVRKVNWPTRGHQYACVNDRESSSSQYRHQSQSLY